VEKVQKTLLTYIVYLFLLKVKKKETTIYDGLANGTEEKTPEKFRGFFSQTINTY